jgi:7,8-dihydro-6-hydroxymethylpterin-pyrophosphokinase
MQQRDFVLYPLREISDTNLVLPDGSDLDTLLQHCPANNLVRTQYQLRIN